MRYVLAPLAGFTDAPFRRLCFEGGADLTYTEMVSAAGLAHGSSPTRHLMETMPGEGPVACQVFGAKETDLAQAAREVESVRSRFVELNLNAGCPMEKVTHGGAGAKLIEDPALVYRLLTALRENTSLPVTLWDERRTTVDAHNILLGNGKRAKERKKTVDAVAASLMLEGYLTFKKRQQ